MTPAVVFPIKAVNHLTVIRCIYDILYGVVSNLVTFTMSENRHPSILETTNSRGTGQRTKTLTVFCTATLSKQILAAFSIANRGSCWLDTRGEPVEITQLDSLIGHISSNCDKLPLAGVKTTTKLGFALHPQTELN